MLAMLGACATPAPPRIVNTACLSFKAISYAQLAPGVTDDPGNVADSPQTVREIETHNARYDEICPRS